MPFVNQEILIGGMVGFLFNGTKYSIIILLEKVAVLICTIKTCVVKSLFAVFRCTCVLLFLLTDLAVFGTEISAFEIF